MEKRPDFFIVGVAKSGTSSLWAYLKAHDQVFMPNDSLFKEPAYFSKKNRFTCQKNYIDLFSSAENSHKRIGEASTAYITDPGAAEKIFRFNPRAKIIITLRNPADRAYSLYNWMVQEGYEYALSFEKALHLEKKRVFKKIPNFWEPEYYWNYMYFQSGLYYEQVKRYLVRFKDNVLILTLDELKSTPQKVYETICSFLEIRTDKIVPTVYNESREVYHPVLQFSLRKLNTGIAQLMKTVFRYHYERKSRRDLFIYPGQKKIPPEKLSEKTRNLLIAAYRDDLMKLSKLTGRTFNHWIS